MIRSFKSDNISSKIDLAEPSVFSCSITGISFIARVFILYIASLYGSTLSAQQGPDLNYSPAIENPAYESGTGPVIFIDEGHNNFHTIEGRYLPFARVLEKDGYIVEPYKGAFTEKALSDGKILVIANALNAVNIDNWALPTPSAFSAEEIEIVRNWVYSGGSLFLIADHMPWPGAAEDLASVFGFTFVNGFNIDIINPAYFWKANNTIVESVITQGRDSSETIYKIPRTEGQAFQIPDDATPILQFDETCLILLPDTAWVFNNETPMKTVDGWSQGAFKKYGTGRVVVFGEASLFSAQIGQPGNRKMGMNSADAKDNYKLLLNSVHWLDGILE